MSASLPFPLPDMTLWSFPFVHWRYMIEFFITCCPLLETLADIIQPLCMERMGSVPLFPYDHEGLCPFSACFRDAA